MFPRDQLIPGRDPLARVLRRGAADAARAPPGSERPGGGLGGTGDVRGQPRARGRPVRKSPGTSRAAAPRSPPPATAAAAAPGALGALALPPLSAALPRPGSCRCLRLLLFLLLPLLLLLLAEGVRRKAGPPPPRRGGPGGRSTCGPRGSGGRGGRAAGEAPEPGRRRNIKE